VRRVFAVYVVTTIGVVVRRIAAACVGRVGVYVVIVVIYDVGIVWLLNMMLVVMLLPIFVVVAAGAIVVVVFVVTVVGCVGVFLTNDYLC